MTTAKPLPHPANPTTWKVRRLGLQDYETTWRAMQDFTAQRDAATTDELWFVEHPAVFTLGLNGKPEHVLASSEIPVIKVDSRSIGTALSASAESAAFHFLSKK